MLCIGWVQAGGAWALRVTSFHMCPKLAYCPFVCRGLKAHCPCFLTSYVGCFFVFPLLSGAGLYLMIGLTFLWPIPWFPLFLAMSFCYSCWASFRPAVYSSSQWLGMATSLLLFVGSYVPFGFPLGILGPFAFFGLPRPFC